MATLAGCSCCPNSQEVWCPRSITHKHTLLVETGSIKNLESGYQNYVVCGVKFLVGFFMFYVSYLRKKETIYIFFGT